MIDRKPKVVKVFCFSSEERKKLKFNSPTTLSQSQSHTLFNFYSQPKKNSRLIYI